MINNTGAELFLMSGSENQVSKVFSKLHEAEQIMFVTMLICLWKDRSKRDEARKVFCDDGGMWPSLFEEEHGKLYELAVGARFHEKENCDRIAVYSSENDMFMHIEMKRDGKTAFGNEKLQMFWKSMKDLVAPSYKHMADYDGYGVVRYHYYTNP